MTHAGESLLSRLRDGLLPLTAEITTALLAMVDAVREMLKSIDAAGKEGERNDQELISKLARLLEPRAVNAASEVTPSKIEPAANSLEQPALNLGEILIKRGVAKAGEVNAAVEHQKAGSPKAESQTVNIVVLRADDRAFGLLVDEINDTEEIVVKPLRKQLKSVNIYAGATIMGDGKVALILDVLGRREGSGNRRETRRKRIDCCDGHESTQAYAVVPVRRNRKDRH